jgi:hypothetical protein
MIDLFRDQQVRAFAYFHEGWMAGVRHLLARELASPVLVLGHQQRKRWRRAAALGDEARKGSHPPPPDNFPDNIGGRRGVCPFLDN